MILYCPHIDDDHASGPHHVVIPVSIITRVTRDDNGRKILERRSVTGDEHVICALCDHWTRRTAGSCRCNCHREASSAN